MGEVTLQKVIHLTIDHGCVTEGGGPALEARGGNIFLWEEPDFT